MRLGKVLKAFREATLRRYIGDPKVPSIQNIADEIGISKATLSRIERGKMCDAETMHKIHTWMMEKQ
jgi:transcriptional regulator with XRE-family HTH domain